MGGPGCTEEFGSLVMVCPLKPQLSKQMELLKYWPAGHRKGVETVDRPYWGDKKRVCVVLPIIDS